MAWNLFESTPVLVGANREERWNRPAEGPALRSEDPRIYAPVDLEAGGTWIGVNEHGVLVAVTNRPGGPPGTRSRGMLIRDALENSTADRALSNIRDELETRSYAGCNLLIASSEIASFLAWDGSIQSYELAAGLHVIVNRGTHDDSAKAATIRSRLLRATGLGKSAFETRLESVLSDHVSMACIHEEARGTRSSSMVEIDRNNHFRWSFANGPPCTTNYRTVLEGEL